VGFFYETCVRRHPLLGSLVTALLFLSCLTSLFPFHIAPVTSFFEEWSSAVCFVAAAGLLTFFLRAKDVCMPRLVVLPLALIAVCIWQAAVGRISDPSRASYFLLMPLLLILTLWVAGNIESLVSSTRAIGAIAGGALTLGLAQLALCFVQYQGYATSTDWIVDPMLQPLRMTGNVAQPNLLALLFAFAIAAALYLGMTGSIRVWLVRLVCALIFIGIGLTGSRVGALDALVVLGAAPFLLQRSEDGSRMLGVKRAALGCVLFLASQWLLVPLVAALLNGGDTGILARGGNLGASTSFRFAHWTVAWHMWLANALLGVGWMGYPGHQIDFIDAVVRDEPVSHAHNLVLQLLAEGGLAGFIAVSLPVLIWLRSVLRSDRTPGRGYALLLAMVFAAHSQLEFPYAYMYILLPVVFIMGLADPVRISLARMAVARWSIVGCTVVAMVLVPYSMHDFLRAAHFYDISSAEYQSGKDEIKSSIVEGQISIFFPWVARQFMLVSMDSDADNLDLKLALSEQALRTYLTNIVVYRRAIYLGHAGRDDEAIVLLKRYAKIRPVESVNVDMMVRATARRYDTLASFAAKLDREFPPDQNAPAH
jgi:O-antigen ligase